MPATSPFSAFFSDSYVLDRPFPKRGEGHPNSVCMKRVLCNKAGSSHGESPGSGLQPKGTSSAHPPQLALGTHLSELGQFLHPHGLHLDLEVFESGGFGQLAASFAWETLLFLP